MSSDTDIDLKAGRRRVARSRGALSGVLIIVLGLWAALAPFIGPYLDFGTQPNPDDAWNWTSGRGLYELLPGGVAVLAGLLLLVSTSRTLTITAAWLAGLAGAWLVVGVALSDVINVDIGGPDPKLGERGRAAEALLYFYAIGGAILFLAGTAVGRLSVHSVRDVKVAERRAEADAAAAAEEQRLEQDRQRAAQEQHAEQQRRLEQEQARAATGVHRDESGRHVDTGRPVEADPANRDTSAFEAQRTDARGGDTTAFARPPAGEQGTYGGAHHSTSHVDQPAYTEQRTDRPDAPQGPPPSQQPPSQQPPSQQPPAGP